MISLDGWSLLCKDGKTILRQGDWSITTGDVYLKGKFITNVRDLEDALYFVNNYIPGVVKVEQSFIPVLYCIIDEAIVKCISLDNHDSFDVPLDALLE